MQESLQHFFHTVPSEGLLGGTWNFILEILGFVFFYGLIVGLILTLIKRLITIGRDRDKPRYIYKPFSRIVYKIESRANFFKKGFLLVLPAGVVFIASIVILLFGMEVIGKNANANYDLLCTVGVLMFLASYIYFIVLYFKRGNYEALTGFYENKLKQYLPPEIEVTEYYEDYTYVGSTSRNLNTGKNVSRGFENVLIVAINIGTFLADILLFIVVNILKGIWKIIETPFCLNLKAKAQKVLKKWLFSQEKRATDIMYSTKPTQALPHSQLEYILFRETVGDVVSSCIDKVRAREDEIDVIFDAKPDKINHHHFWSDKYFYYHTKKLMGEFDNNGSKELMYETDTGILFMVDIKETGVPTVCMFVPFMPTSNWLQQYNKSEIYIKNAARRMETVYLAHKKQTDSPDDIVTVLYYENEQKSASTNAIVISARLADISLNEKGEISVSEYKKVKLKGGGAGNGGNPKAIAGFILSFFYPILGIIFSIVGYSDAKKKNLPYKGLAKAGIIISIVFCAISIVISTRLN